MEVCEYRHNQNKQSERTMTQFLSVKEYFKAHSTCPCCKHDMVEGGSVDIDNDIAEQEVSCGNCGAEWTDIYRLASYVPTSAPEDSDGTIEIEDDVEQIKEAIPTLGALALMDIMLNREDLQFNLEITELLKKRYVELASQFQAIVSNSRDTSS